MVEINLIRSHGINTDKFRSTGFITKKTLGDTIVELKERFKNCELSSKSIYYNLK